MPAGRVGSGASRGRAELFRIGEAWTLVTDYAVALLALGLAARLRARAATRPMAPAIAWVALAAFAGGTFHGLRAGLGLPGKIALWGLTSVALAAASFSLLVGYGRARLQPRWHDRLRALALGKLAVLVVLLLLDPGILWLIVDYLSSMLLLVGLYAANEPRARASVWLYAAVGLSVAGALIQRLRIAPSTAFNHNDLYHVVQMVSLVCFYRTAVCVAAEQAHA